MLEFKKVYNNFYGTSKQSYLDILKRNKIPLLDVDVEGMLDIRRNIYKLQEFNQAIEVPDVICIMPPSW